MNREELQRAFEIKLNYLSVRAKNILAALRLLNFENFYQYFIEQQKYIDFKKVRNCGTGTEKQLNKFVEEFIKEKESANTAADITAVINLKSKP
jgi:hypothetical protein